VNTVARNTPELLAPAGDWDALRAAVANGADAVYFGLPEFNARRRAANFAPESLPEVVAYLHDHNVKAHVAFNTLVFSDELRRAAEYIARIAEAGADAVIVQDLALVRLIGRMAPTLPIHASTQMTQTECRGIEYLRSLGVRRIILARELSLSRIGELVRQVRVELEVFVHGALCVSYSGQCLASESLFGRSANRGECAQACRLPYQIVVDGTPAPRFPAYLLSPNDLVAADRVAELVRLGVAALKIEGRLKSARYVAATTQVYRSAIDAALAGKPFSLSPEQERDLAQSFSRGGTRGFLDGASHQTLIDGRSPKSRGIRVGTVTGRTPRGIVVRIDSPGTPGGLAATLLKAGDGVVFDEGRPDRDEQGGRIYSVEPLPDAEKGDRPFRGKGETDGRAGGRGGGSRLSFSRGGTSRFGKAPAAARAGDRFELTFGRDDLNLAAVPIGSTVWKTDDPVVRRRWERSFRRDRIVRRVPLTARVHACAGSPLEITLVDDTGHEAHVTSDGPLQAAKKHLLTTATLREQLGRLGDTPFELRSVELQGPAGTAVTVPVMAPKSVLNDLRRRAVQALRECRSREARHAALHPGVVDAIRREIGSGESASRRATVAVGAEELRRVSADVGQEDFARLYVLVRDADRLRTVLQWAAAAPRPPAMIYCDFADLKDYAEAVARVRSAGLAVGLAVPRILKPGEEALVRRIAEHRPDALLVRNLGALELLRSCAVAPPLIADFSLNVANEIAASMLRELGVRRIVPGHDLDWRRVKAMLSHAPAGWFEIVIRQHVPLFHMEHCLFAARLSRGGDCTDCGRPCKRHRLALRDRVGAVHPVLTDAGGRNTVFNGSAQSVLERVAAMRSAGLRHFRVELLTEPPEEVCALLDSCAESLQGE